MFEVIGERINTSRKLVQKAVADRDTDYIIDDVKKQQEAGASYIDVNAGARIGHEAADMKWLLDTIQPVAAIPLTLDSPDPAVLETAFTMVEKTPMINSISLEKERFDAMMPFLEGKDCKVIVLCMDDAGMPAPEENHQQDICLPDDGCGYGLCHYRSPGQKNNGCHQNCRHAFRA